MKGTSKMNGLLCKSKSYLKRSSPTILTCVSVIGVVATTVMAVRATPKVMRLIEQSEVEKSLKLGQGSESLDGELTPLEVVQLTWKCYIPAALVGLSTIACIFGANALNQRQQASLTSAYALVNSSYKEYKSKLKELYGEEAHQKIMRELAVEKAENIPIEAVTFLGGQTLGFDDLDTDECLFYDSIGDRYFTSTIIRVLEAEYHFNRNFCLGWIPSLNDFYEFLGLEKTECGDAVGWTNSNGDYYWIDFFHTHTEIDGTMDCWVIETAQPPTPEFLEDI